MSWFEWKSIVFNVLKLLNHITLTPIEELGVRGDGFRLSVCWSSNVFLRSLGIVNTNPSGYGYGVCCRWGTFWEDLQYRKMYRGWGKCGLVSPCFQILASYIYVCSWVDGLALQCWISYIMALRAIFEYTEYMSAARPKFPLLSMEMNLLFDIYPVISYIACI